MITFKQFLSEARMAPLYHGTTVKNAIRIIERNELWPFFADNTDAISLTRSLDFALKWPIENSSATPDEIIVFELDQQKLSQNYKIKPYNYFRYTSRISGGGKVGHPKGWNEYEERVEDRVIKNVDKYITKVIPAVKPGKRIKGNVILNHPKLFYNIKFLNK